MGKLLSLEETERHKFRVSFHVHLVPTAFAEYLELRYARQLVLPVILSRGVAEFQRPCAALEPVHESPAHALRCCNHISTIIQLHMLRRRTNRSDALQAMLAADFGVDQKDATLIVGHDQNLVLRNVSRRQHVLDRVKRILDVLRLDYDPSDRETAIYRPLHLVHLLLLALRQEHDDVNIVETFDLRLQHLVPTLQPHQFRHEAGTSALATRERMLGQPLQQFLQR
mmetsp:Transcript_83974/g.256533  ORF Transcript_83974/g.256533 Transcript_83974/m.256533 type:complete len:226 (-) Transcript_83974:208-885(-)